MYMYDYNTYINNAIQVLCIHECVSVCKDIISCLFANSGTKDNKIVEPNSEPHLWNKTVFLLFTGKSDFSLEAVMKICKLQTRTP